MKGAVEFSLAAGVAVGLHLMALAQLPGGNEGAGHGGAETASIAAADGALAALVAGWERPPEVAAALPQSAPRPALSDPSPPVRADSAAPAAPVAAPVPSPVPSPVTMPAATADSAPQAAAPPPDLPADLPADPPPGLPDDPAPAAPLSVPSAAPGPPAAPLPMAPDTSPVDAPSERLAAAGPAAPDAPPRAPDAPPPPPGEAGQARATAPHSSPRPPPRPEAPARNRASEAPAAQPPAAQASRPAQAPQRAAGQGVAGPQGQQGTTPAPGLSQAARQALMADWGGAIRARIEARRPAVSGRGAVGLSLRIGRDGRLIQTGIAQSSGHGALDRAALAAVQRAGRFPPAPEGLSAAHYDFRLVIRFD